MFLVHEDNPERQSRLTNSNASADSLTAKDGTKWVLARAPEHPGRMQHYRTLFANSLVSNLLGQQELAQVATRGLSFRQRYD